MQASKQNLADIFNGHRVFKIPFYQRRYVWKEDQWKRFLEDMEYISSSQNDYFLGSLILKQEGTNVGEINDRRIIIDGQQRLTTFVLFAKALCLKTDDSQTFETHFTVRDRNRNKSLALLHNVYDRESFNTIFYLDNCSTSFDDTSNISKCFQYFVENIDINKLNVDVLLTHVIFIDIDLHPSDNEQLIFDTINSLGMRLTTGELLKNYFFSEDSENEYNDLWKPTFEASNEIIAYWDTQVTLGRIVRSNIEVFFQAFLNIKMQDSKISLSDEQKNKFRRANNLFQNYKELVEYNHLDKKCLISEIIEYAKVFRECFKTDILSRQFSGDYGLDRIHLIINVFDTSTMVPYVIFVQKNVKDLEERKKIYGYLETYIVRRQICKSCNDSYSDLFTENLIGRNILTYNELKKYIEAKEKTTALSMPSDDLVKECLWEKKVPNKRALAILYLMESRIRKQHMHATQLFPFKEYSLEHMMPQKYQKHWPLPPSMDAEEREHRIHTLGNMAMLPHSLNSSVSNSSWKQKKEGNKNAAGLKDLASDIEILSEVLKENTWDEQKIYQRSLWLADKVAEIWPLDTSKQIKKEVSYDYSEESANHVVHESSYKKAFRDRTKYSLNGGPFQFKSMFVLDLVKAYVKTYPSATYKQIKEVFNDKLCDKDFKCIGFLCTVDEYNRWQSKTKETRYKPNRPGGRLVSADGVAFFVNTQWTKDAMGPIVEVATREGFIVQETDER